MPGAPGLSLSPTTARPPSTSCAMRPNPIRRRSTSPSAASRSVGLTAPNWVRLDLPPKLYDLRAYGTQTNSELIITVAPGQTRFLLAQPTPTGGAELLELSQEQGRKLVRRGERLWTPELDFNY